MSETDETEQARGTDYIYNEDISMSTPLNRLRQRDPLVNETETEWKRRDSVEVIVEGDPLAGTQEDGEVKLEEVKLEPDDYEYSLEGDDLEDDNVKEEEEAPSHLYLEDLQTAPADEDLSDLSEQKIGANAKTFMCSICNSVFMGHNRLRMHMRRKHGLFKKNFKYSCKVCGEWYEYKTSLMAHARRLHGPEAQGKDDDKTDVRCDICGSILVGKRRLWFHMQRMHQIEQKSAKYKCPRCPCTYDKETSLKMHHQRKHSSSKKVEQDIHCPLCPKQFTSRPSYMAHLTRTHHSIKSSKVQETDAASDVLNCDSTAVTSTAPPISLECTVCSTVFLDQSRLRMHMRLKHNLLKNTFEYNCTVCGESYDQKNSLRAHMKRKHAPEVDKTDDEKELTCKICGYILAGKRRLDFHMQRMHKVDSEPSEFKCDNCPRSYDKVTSLYMHTKRKHHPSSDLTVQCTLCPKRFTKRPSYIAHLKSHHYKDDSKVESDSASNDESIHNSIDSSDVPHQGNDNISCSQCPLLFSDANRLRLHMKRAHDTESETFQYKCTFCSLTYDKKASLINHVSRKHNRELFCQTCKKQFTSHEMFRNHSHANIHIGQQTPVYQCGICKMIYVREGSLAKHMRLSHNIVTSDMTLFCKVCGKGFWKQTYLNSHMKLHEGATYACNFCQKIYKVKDTLRQHILRQHLTSDKSTFPCRHCGQSFPNKNGLRNHIAAEHPDEADSNINTEEIEESTLEVKKEDDILDGGEHSKKGLIEKRTDNANAKDLQCPECEKLFENPHKLRAHVKKVHDKLNRAPEVVCQHCGLVTNTVKLNKHMVVEHKDMVEIFKCEQCNFKTWKKALLWKHEQSHMLEHKFQCSFEGCNYKTYARHRLLKHWSTHAEKVRLHCSQCSYESNDSHVMKNHEEEHVTGKKKYSCMHCEYSTNYPANISMHRYKHSDERNFHCSQCEFSTKYPTALNIHKKKFHSDKSTLPIHKQKKVKKSEGVESEEATIKAQND